MAEGKLTYIQSRQNKAVTWQERREQAQLERAQRLEELDSKKGFFNAVAAPARLAITICFSRWTWVAPPKRYGPHLTYGERKRIARTYELELSHQRLQKVFGPLKLYRPHYLKHPTEDREVTYAQWKHAQKMVIFQEKRLYQHMKNEHSLLIRYMIWASQPGSILGNWMKAATSRTKRVAQYPQTHIMPWNRRTMQRRNVTEEEMLARKAENLVIRKEGRKFWLIFPTMVHYAAPRIKTFVNNTRNSLRKQ